MPSEADDACNIEEFQERMKEGKSGQTLYNGSQHLVIVIFPVMLFSGPAPLASELIRTEVISPNYQTSQSKVQRQRQQVDPPISTTSALGLSRL